jgi:hypothetical protein
MTAGTMRDHAQALGEPIIRAGLLAGATSRFVLVPLATSSPPPARLTSAWYCDRRTSTSAWSSAPSGLAGSMSASRRSTARHSASTSPIRYILAESFGGAPFAIANTAVLCRSCNSTKGSSTDQGGVARTGTRSRPDRTVWRWRCPKRLKWRARQDSNLRPSAPEADALSTELQAREPDDTRCAWLGPVSGSTRRPQRDHDQPPARANVTCVTPLGEDVASIA